MSHSKLIARISLALCAASLGPIATQAHHLGYSVGRWEGSTLVVRTTNINWPYLDRTGVPISDEVVVDERFEIDESGSRMVIRVVTTDPVNLEAPVTTQRNYG